MSRIPNRITIARNTLKENDLSRIVTEIGIVGIPTLEGNPPDSIYHFHFSLIFGDMTSVGLDIQPGLLDNPQVKQRGLLTIESKDHAMALDDTISWDYDNLAVPTTAGDILDYLLNDKKRDQYDFNDNGEGCIPWCEVVLKDLIDMGIVPAGALAEFNAWERAEMKKQGSGRMTDPRGQGKFYD